MMHDPKVIEVMEVMVGLVAGEASATMRATTQAFMEAALAALCRARPDVAAVLKGEAVVMPREATEELVATLEDPLRAEPDEAWQDYQRRKWAELIAASPYAREEGA